MVQDESNSGKLLVGVFSLQIVIIEWLVNDRRVYWCSTLVFIWCSTLFGFHFLACAVTKITKWTYIDPMVQFCLDRKRTNLFCTW